MIDVSALPSLHFLRPHWLWALIALAIVVILLARQQSTNRQWRRIIAPHLLEHLVIKPQGRRGPRPLHLLAVIGALAVFALAGPAWQREPSPFASDTAPLVIALELSPQMEVRDVQPSRLARSKQKIRDLVTQRAGAPTALLVYAGTAHRVLPLTDDPAAITAFVDDLEPSLMPIEGRVPELALDLSAELLDHQKTPGTVLFVTSGIPESAIDAFETFSDSRLDQLQVLAVATEAGGSMPQDKGFSALDRASLDILAARTGTVITLVTVDDSDIERILRLGNRHLEMVQQNDSEGRWRDEGWWLVLPLAAITLLWFRRGWFIRWES